MGGRDTGVRERQELDNTDSLSPFVKETHVMDGVDTEDRGRVASDNRGPVHSMDVGAHRSTMAHVHGLLA